MPPKTKFKSMTNDMHNDKTTVSTTIPQNRHASTPLSGNLYYIFLS